jgi:hypothetical protein
VVFGRLPAELRTSVAAAGALSDNATTGNPWLLYWLLGAVRLQNRIPLDLPSGVMGELVDLYTNRSAEIESNFFVCDGCGLRRPYRKQPFRYWYTPDPPLKREPEFFDSCPFCGHKEWMWENRTEEKDYPWRALAREELGR